MSKLYFSVLFLLLGFLSCKSAFDNESGISLLDMAKEYPIKDIDIHDIADVEYIPLETTDNSLLPRVCSSFWISDKYIVTHDIEYGNVYFFNRSGKYLWTFNRRGGGAEEYNYIILLAIDFEAEECFVSDGTDRISVYSFKGDFKRLLIVPIENFHQFTVLIDYDKYFLIGYNGSFAFDVKDGINDRPYCLINKQTGVKSILNLVTKHHISPTVHEASEIAPMRVRYTRNPLMKNGLEYLISDYAFDTIYHYVEHKLSPIAVRTPGVYAASVPTVIVPWLFTDTYLCFRLLTMKYDPVDPMKYENEAPELVWNRRTGELEQWKLFDSNYSTKYGRATPHSFMLFCTSPNYGIGWFSPDKLQERSEAGELKGKLKDIAQKLKEDDNLVLMVCKFK